MDDIRTLRYTNSGKRTNEELKEELKELSRMPSNCKKCYGRGHLGRFISGEHKGKIIACKCILKKKEVKL